MVSRRIIRHLEGLTVGQGHGYGKPFPVWPWERRFLSGAFRPGIAEAVLSVGRGAGKTTLIAGIATACLNAPGVAQPESEILVIASSQDQGGIAFRHMLRFLPPGQAGFRVRDTKQEMLIASHKTGVRVKVLPALPRALHGAAPSLIIADEVAQWPPTKIDRMLAALRSSAGKIPGCRLILFGTRPATAAHPMELAIRTADYAQVHKAAESDPAGWKSTWAKANPSIKYNPVLEQAYRREAKRAKLSPDEMVQFRALRLNMGCADTLQSFLADADVWRRAEGEAPKSGACYWGIDLGQTKASSAITCYWPKTGRLESLGSFGQVPDLAERGERDGVGRLYVEAHKRGELVTLGEEIPPPWQLITCAAKRFGRPRAIACDSWRIGELKEALSKAGMHVPLDHRRQGFGDGGEDVRNFRAALRGGDVTPVPSLFLAWAVSESRTVSDAAGNHKLAKNAEGGRRKMARDDAAAAAILAVSLAVRKHKSERTGYRLRLIG